VSKDGTIVNAPVSFDVNPAGLDHAYLENSTVPYSRREARA